MFTNTIIINYVCDNNKLNTVLYYDYFGFVEFSVCNCRDGLSFTQLSVGNTVHCETVCSVENTVFRLLLFSFHPLVFVFNDISIGFIPLCTLFRRTRILLEWIVVISWIVSLESFYSSPGVLSN